ncbi:MAG: TIR domain-containing protein [Candidatus Pacebacteria bacterium]|nr:TIR domain-containing protein [Candidatus Paceibacterota bacterium]
MTNYLELLGNTLNKQPNALGQHTSTLARLVGGVTTEQPKGLVGLSQNLQYNTALRLQHNIGVFISHSWQYSENYDKLSKWIFKTSWSVANVPVSFKNQSVPKESPIHNTPTDAALRQAIFSRIEKSDIVVIPTGMFANYSKWIKQEILGAKQYNKPILAVKLWGRERSSSVVLENATDSTGWKKESVINGIWGLYDKCHR